jgi:hypothetical protein
MKNENFHGICVRVETHQHFMALAKDPAIGMMQADFIEALLVAWESLGPMQKVRCAQTARETCRKFKRPHKADIKKKEKRA